MLRAQTARFRLNAGPGKVRERLVTPLRLKCEAGLRYAVIVPSDPQYCVDALLCAPPPPPTHTPHQSNTHSAEMVATIGKPAPAFKGPAVVNGEIKEISLSDFKGERRAAAATARGAMFADCAPHASS